MPLGAGLGEQGLALWRTHVGLLHRVAGGFARANNMECTVWRLLRCKFRIGLNGPRELRTGSSKDASKDNGKSW